MLIFPMIVYFNC